MLLILWFKTVLSYLLRDQNSIGCLCAYRILCALGIFWGKNSSRRSLSNSDCGIIIKSMSLWFSPSRGQKANRRLFPIIIFYACMYHNVPARECWTSDKGLLVAPLLRSMKRTAFAQAPTFIAAVLWNRILEKLPNLERLWRLCEALHLQ